MYRRYLPANSLKTVLVGFLLLSLLVFAGCSHHSRGHHHGDTHRLCASCGEGKGTAACKAECKSKKKKCGSECKKPCCGKKKCHKEGDCGKKKSCSDCDSAKCDKSKCDSSDCKNAECPGSDCKSCEKCPGK